MPDPTSNVAFSRRQVMAGLGAGAGAASLAGCAAPLASSAARTPPALAPFRVSADRVFDTTVCLRPFRAAGPRIETEQVGDKLIVHNYGHGGSGWSLSWGSGTLALALAMQNSPRAIAVVGCGALGLTAATLAQRAGAQVTIYARDLLPQARSARATGSFTPDSRVALRPDIDAAFADRWEQMTRTSFKAFRSYLGLPGDPIEWTDRYIVSDAPMGARRSGGRAPATGELDFAHFSERIRDLSPRAVAVSGAASPVSAPHVYRSEGLTFNIANYGHTLMRDFFAAGGRFVRREFRSPADYASIAEPVVINCPGYDARALWRDDSVVPVRGQISWLIPQADVRYGVFYRGVSLMARRDGVVLQATGPSEMYGYNETSEQPDPAETARAIAVMAPLFAGR